MRYKTMGAYTIVHLYFWEYQIRDFQKSNFTEMLETLDFMRFSGINNNINKLFTFALSG